MDSDVIAINSSIEVAEEQVDNESEDRVDVEEDEEAEDEDNDEDVDVEEQVEAELEPANQEDERRTAREIRAQVLSDGLRSNSSLASTASLGNRNTQTQPGLRLHFEVSRV